MIANGGHIHTKDMLYKPTSSHQFSRRDSGYLTWHVATRAATGGLVIKVAGYRAVIVRSWRAPRARRSIAISRLSKSGYF